MLIASRAFVVQVDTASSLTEGSFAGRVDHIVSGETAHFMQLDDLLAFMRSRLEAHAADPTERSWLPAKPSSQAAPTSR